jgi:hypothetical protein
MATRHQQLFAEYVQELEAAKAATSEWWESLLAKEEQLLGDRERAVQSVRQRWPHGSGVHPYVVAVVRKYYFACDALNQEIEKLGDASLEGEEEFVYPHHFVIDLLMDGDHDDLLAFISAMPYLPIGLEP